MSRVQSTRAPDRRLAPESAADRDEDKEAARSAKRRARSGPQGRSASGRAPVFALRATSFSATRSAAVSADFCRSGARVL